MSDAAAVTRGQRALDAVVRGKVVNIDKPATSTEIANAFDVNDVSILLPMRGDTPYPQIRVSGIAAAGADTAPAAEQLWPKDIWEQVIAQARSHGIESGQTGEADFFKLRGLWHIAAVRFDPCAPGFDQATLDAVPGPTNRTKETYGAGNEQRFPRRQSLAYGAGA